MTFEPTQTLTRSQDLVRNVRGMRPAWRGFFVAMVIGGVGLSGCARTTNSAVPLGVTFETSDSTGLILSEPVEQTVPPTAAPATTVDVPASTINMPPPAAVVVPDPDEQAEDQDGSVEDFTAGGGERMSFEEIRLAINPTPEIVSIEPLAWGDIDADGDEDAVVRLGICGASCGTAMLLVLDADPEPQVYDSGMEDTFAPWYNGGGAAQSDASSVEIVGSTVVIIGTRLCGDVAGIADAPWPCAYSESPVSRTATYEYVDGAVMPVSIEPPLG